MDFNAPRFAWAYATRAALALIRTRSLRSLALIRCHLSRVVFLFICVGKGEYLHGSCEPWEYLWEILYQTGQGQASEAKRGSD